MRRPTTVLAFVLLGCGCLAAVQARAKVPELEFLTRGECVNTPKMRANLAALKTLGLSTTYAVVDLDEVSKNDSKTGYPTPTILYQDADLFGMPAPQPPFPDPT